MDDDLIALLIGIDGVEDIAGLDLEPAHLTLGPIALHDAEPRARLSFERQGGLPLHRGAQVKNHRQVHKDHVVSGDVPVMHHHRIGQVNRLSLDHLPGPVDAVIGQVRRTGQLIAEEQKLARLWTFARMGGHGPGQLAAVIMRAQRIEITINRPRQMGLLQCQPLARMADDVGIGGGSCRIKHARHHGHVGLIIGRADIAIAIVRLTIFELDRMEHAIAREPMIAMAGPRVHTHAHIVAKQVLGDLAGDL